MSALQRQPSGQFAPGVSGNKTGRPKGFAGLSKTIRNETQDGAELVKFALAVLRSDAEETRDRIAALVWLGDRGWGKPVSAVELTLNQEQQPTPTYNFDAMPIAERQELLAKIRSLRQLEASTEEGDG